jgi:PncC family amidohydrolase
MADEARELAGFLAAKSLTLAAAESCTAGLVADALARIPGASNVFWGSFVCYTAEAKTKMLGIDGAFLRRYGLVSGETSRAMAAGALEKSGADCAVSVTGLAGPGGDGSGVSVGTVWIGAAVKGAPAARAAAFHFTGCRRNRLRKRAARQAIREITKLLQEFF